LSAEVLASGRLRREVVSMGKVLNVVAAAAILGAATTAFAEESTHRTTGRI
jgi:hypothetical protein